MGTPEGEDFWQKAFRDLETSLPEDGIPPPDMEKIPPKPKPIKDGNRRVMVQRILTRIYVFTDVDGKVYASNTAQTMHVLGMMTLSQAMKRAQEDENF